LKSKTTLLITGNKILSKIFVYFVLILISLFAFFPVFWMFSTSFKPKAEAFEMPPTWIPRTPTFANYIKQFEEFGGKMTAFSGFPTFYKNGVIVAAGVATLTMILSILAGYSFSRYKFFGKNGILIFLIITQMFPYAVIIVNILIIFKKLALLNTYIGLMLAITALTLPFSIWLLKGFFDKIPMELEEAALVDGCSRMSLLFRILVPVVSPGVISVGLFSFLASWNQLLFALQLAYKNSMFTIPPGFLQLYVGQYMILWSEMSAGSVMVTLPIIIAFMALQRYFVQGLTAGAVKG